jgi:predicted unusual protein kinase regulating ubiquinone biosynthesis (AarF/ABC1/UbiB family)
MTENNWGFGVADKYSDDRAGKVPTSRLSRLFSLGSMASGIAGRMAVDGISQLAQGKRPDLATVLLTPLNTLRFTQSLSHLRGAALKLGQMISMDPGVLLPPELTDILATLRDDAKPMPQQQLQQTLDRQWGTGWLSKFARFDMRPFAAASIGQVHRARLKDGQELAIKVQYPGVRTSINSDVDNVATLMRMPGLLPRDMNIAPLIAEAKRQLHEEADYVAEARHLKNFRQLLAGSDTFITPDIHQDLCTDSILAMTYIEGQSLDALATAEQEVRDRVAAQLIELVLRELFVFGAMQTDPNLANYRYQPATGKIVLLDFGAVRTISPDMSANFRALLNAVLDENPVATRAAMQKIGYFDSKVATHHQNLILKMFNTAMEPLRQDAVFDFGKSDLLERLRDMGLAIGNDRTLTHVPPAETLFLHRKIGGMYLLAAKLRARVALRPMLKAYR